MTTGESVNYWREDACAKAFWSQCDMPPYRRLLGRTVEWLDPQPGEPGRPGVRQRPAGAGLVGEERRRPGRDRRDGLRGR